jgi:hypothetical protein
MYSIDRIYQKHRTDHVSRPRLASFGGESNLECPVYQVRLNLDTALPNVHHDMLTRLHHSEFLDTTCGWLA